jgi:hypothetical protein
MPLCAPAGTIASVPSAAHAKCAAPVVTSRSTSGTTCVGVPVAVSVSGLN